MAKAAARVVPRNLLHRMVAGIFTAAGCSDEHAATVADVLVWANLRGVDLHGVVRVPRYIELFKSGEAKARPAIKVQRPRASVVVVDADGAPGPVALQTAMTAAIDAARTSGIAWAAVRGTVHTGAIGYYADLAAQQGMIGVGMVAGIPNMAYHGARGAAVATSPARDRGSLRQPRDRVAGHGDRDDRVGQDRAAQDPGTAVAGGRGARCRRAADRRRREGRDAAPHGRRQGLGAIVDVRAHDQRADREPDRRAVSREGAGRPQAPPERRDAGDRYRGVRRCRRIPRDRRRDRRGDQGAARRRARMPRFCSRASGAPGPSRNASAKGFPFPPRHGKHWSRRARQWGQRSTPEREFGMAITRIEALTFGVLDLDACIRFFGDAGLEQVEAGKCGRDLQHAGAPARSSQAGRRSGTAAASHGRSDLARGGLGCR